LRRISELQDGKERVVTASRRLNYILTYQWMRVSERIIFSKRIAHIGTGEPFGIPGQAAFIHLVLFPDEREHKLDALNHLSNCETGVALQRGRVDKGGVCRP